MALLQRSVKKTNLNGAKFKIGNGTHLGNLDGSVQELIIYNRTLASSEVAQIQDYLNKKYKIY